MVYINNSLQKNFSVDNVKIIELQIAHTWRHMQSEKMKKKGVVITTKKVNKN